MELRYILAGKSLALDTGACTGCGCCVEVCPHAVFAISKRKAGIAVRGRCMECGACGLNCPVGAITVVSGVGCTQAVLNGILTGTEPHCDCGCETDTRKNAPDCC